MNAKISQAILNLIEAGQTIEEAINTVLGQGTYSKIVSDLYDDLRKS